MLEGKRRPGERVLVYDAEGYFVAAGLAEKLAPKAAVELVTPHERSRPLCDETLEGPLLRRHLHDVGVAHATGNDTDAGRAGPRPAADEFGEPVRARGGRASCSSRSGSPTTRSTASSRPRSGALADEGIEALYRIGDCVAPRIIAEAIFDGHRLAREIDAENPALPLPYKRERLVLESVTTA